MKTEWRATDSPRWLAVALLATVVVLAPVLYEGLVQHRPFWSVPWGPAILVALVGIVGTGRSRLRLTDDGVEVRRLRTRLFRWSDIASVERAPEWETRWVVWLRLRASVPTSAPEVLDPPGVRGRDELDRTLNDLVTVIRERAGLDDGDPARRAPVTRAPDLGGLVATRRSSVWPHLARGQTRYPSPSALVTTSAPARAVGS